MKECYIIYISIFLLILLNYNNKYENFGNWWEPRPQSSKPLICESGWLNNGRTCTCPAPKTITSYGQCICSYPNKPDINNVCNYTCDEKYNCLKKDNKMCNSDNSKCVKYECITDADVAYIGNNNVTCNPSIDFKYCKNNVCYMK